MSTETEAVTFLIASYKGLHLLQENLDSVIDQARDGDQIMITEDDADDETNRRYFQEKFGLQKVNRFSFPGDVYQGVIEKNGRKILFNFLQRRSNGRFARNVNDAVKLIWHKYFFLLNSDVKLQPGVRDQLLSHFADEKVFAVGARELDVHDDNKPSGRNKLWWRAGRFWHSRDERLDETGETAWACGGSSMYRTSMWREIGGFDTRFYPAYWEDIDVSFQARKRGYKVIYDSEAVVLHAHETTNSDVFGQEKMTQMSWTAGSRFAWKNANWWQKLQFLVCYPWWQTKQFPAYIWWWLVILLALVTRLELLSVPNGLTVDEAAIGYNAYGIWTERRDEWLSRLPVSFRSFGDYKAPLAIYAAAPWVGILGRSIVALRLPFALAGVASVWLMMCWLSEIFKKNTHHHLLYAAAGGLLMATLPWHYHFSHLGFENNWALFFFVTALYCGTKFWYADNDWRGRRFDETWWSVAALMCGVSSVLALYSYHASKVVLPLLAVILMVVGGKKLWARWRVLLTALAVSTLVAWPLVRDSLWGEGLTRANSLFILETTTAQGTPLTASAKATIFLDNVMAHFSPAYLLGGQLDVCSNCRGETVANIRHGDGTYGVLSWSMAVLTLLSIVSLMSRSQLRRDYGRIGIFGGVLIVVGTLPALLATNVPHSNRAILSLPGFVLLATLGWISWRAWWRKRAEFYPGMCVLLTVIVVLDFLHLRYSYRQTFVGDVSAASEQLAARRRDVSCLFAQNFIDALRLADEQSETVSRIILATGFEQQYIYMLYASGYRPISWQGGAWADKYVFVSELALSECNQADALIIYTPPMVAADKSEAILEKCAKRQDFFDGNGEVNLSLCWTKKEAY